MARSLDQIRQDQDRLEKATVKLDGQLANLYQQYLQVLGEAVRHQLVLATYHLCTQTYPEAFLRLSMGQREKLQKGIRQLGHKGKTHIEALDHLDNVAATLSLLLQPQRLGGLFAAQSRKGEGQDDFEGVESDALDLPTLKSDKSSSEPHPGEATPQSVLLLSSPSSKPFDGKALVPLPADVEHPAPPSEPETSRASEAPSPLKLAKRHVLLERQIRAILHTLSNMTNHALQQAGILPDLPEAVLTAATEAEADEQAPSIPNLLNVIVEIGHDHDNDDDDDDDDDALEDFEEEDPLEELEAPERTMTHLVALNLRLADIEFTDTRTALWRSKIQEILGQLKKLSRHYQKLQQERAQAEAEAAWRATWFEEEPRDPS
ncbi:MAG: hypothetical protein O2890_12625 [Cyanobacteria bacterium]|nr:hypothetical protein [Cyanobacteriota bacterium]MDA0867234.1 hypothetical protein [Cyanobacteriota bacterium]